MIRLIFSIPTLTVLLLIRAWRNIFSPDHGVLGRLIQPHGACRFSPTCSHYAEAAIQKYGLMKGGILSFKRIFRCHPFNRGGNDPVP